ncbi:chitooligosaccharide deacetylase [bacterium CG17_big_fil_post_rev_8_21_14_2_50_64_8]|nr:MAG: chitooligosaccharide deacetylase [bacterium CG17_big_fil_post_rev_8_21_14_2_50_64_8]PJA76890.1 MAG: chitooligosaccharide deacetylase [bacterium CG_4_9_14_3_um_filter_65_15]
MSRSLLDVPAVRDYLGRRLLCSIKTEQKILALTFDDGPNPRHTPQLLSLLASKGIHATFFAVGKRVRRFPEILKATHEAGHEVGNHGDHHVALSLLPPALLRREITRCGEAIEQTIGEKPRFLRPPMGWINGFVLKTVRELGYEPVIGSIHPRDSRRPGREAIIERVQSRVEPGAVIILHDGGWWLGVDRSQTLEAVDVLTDQCLEAGYRFLTLSALSAAGDRW